MERKCFFFLQNKNLSHTSHTFNGKQQQQNSLFLMEKQQFSPNGNTTDAGNTDTGKTCW